MATEFKFDVFISYSSKDADWVRGELLPRIEAAGLKAFIDFRDFTRGAPSITECERGVVECRKTLLVLSPHYTASNWTEFESVLVQSLDPANRGLRLIPLLKESCKKPLRIGALTHIDFTEKANHDLAWQQLLTSLGVRISQKSAKTPTRGDWFLAHPYPMPPNFIGRQTERNILSKWLNNEQGQRLLCLRALGGFGKSALTWHWLMHDVDPAARPNVIWWSFYERNSGFESFLREFLFYFHENKADTEKMPPRRMLEEFLRMLRQPGFLLVLDGFERALRAFGGMNAAYQGDEETYDISPSPSKESERDCISPLAEKFLRSIAALPDIRARVLLTTRLTPRVLETRGLGLLEGCRELELQQLHQNDVFAFFEVLGIRGTQAEIKSACDSYGNHPLSLSLLAGLIRNDLEKPNDITVAERLDITGDLVQRQHHVLEASYDRLSQPNKRLLCRIACFRGPVDYSTLDSLAEEEEDDNFDANLHELVSRGLLFHDKVTARFDLHPIVRRYAYDRMTDPDRSAAHTKLRNYFAAVPKSETISCIEDLAPVVELYHHTVRAQRYDEAQLLLRDRIHHVAYYRLGAYQLQIDLLRALFSDNRSVLQPQLRRKSDCAWALNALANSYGISGQPHRAIPLYREQAKIWKRKGSDCNLAINLENMATQLLDIGELLLAEKNLRDSISISCRIESVYREGTSRRELSRVLAYRGEYSKSDSEIATSLKLLNGIGKTQAMSIACTYQAISKLLNARTMSIWNGQKTSRKSKRSRTQKVRYAIQSAHRALELADETARNGLPFPRDYTLAHWLIGASHCAAGNFTDAARHLDEAIERCRRINMVDHEADILVDLARLCSATKNREDAKHHAEGALLISERSGYVFQGADAHLELAKLAAGSGDRNAALRHARQAKHLAACDNHLEYTYKAAYDEACAALRNLEGA